MDFQITVLKYPDYQGKQFHVLSQQSTFQVPILPSFHIIKGGLGFHQLSVLMAA